MEQILLVSENFCKKATNLSDNISGKLLEPAIFEAQETGLRGILGDKLTDKLKDLVDTEEIEHSGNTKYKTLLTNAQYFLAYETAANITILTAVKIDNAGLSTVSDERMTPLSLDDSFRIQNFYREKADGYCRKLQNFLLQHRSDYPELSDANIHGIKANLWNSATTGLWLGGVRGKSRYGYKYNRYRLRDKYDN